MRRTYERSKGFLNSLSSSLRMAVSRSSWQLRGGTGAPQQRVSRQEKCVLLERYDSPACARQPRGKAGAAQQCVGIVQGRE